MSSRRSSRRSASPRRDASDEPGVACRNVRGIDCEAATHHYDGLPSVTARAFEGNGPQTNIYSHLMGDTLGSMIGIGTGVEGITAVLHSMLDLIQNTTGGVGRMVLRMHPDPYPEPVPDREAQYRGRSRSRQRQPSVSRQSQPSGSGENQPTGPRRGQIPGFRPRRRSASPPPGLSRSARRRRQRSAERAARLASQSPPPPSVSDRPPTPGIYGSQPRGGRSSAGAWVTEAGGAAHAAHAAATDEAMQRQQRQQQYREELARRKEELLRRQQERLSRPQPHGTTEPSSSLLPIPPAAVPDAESMNVDHGKGKEGGPSDP